MTIKNILIIMLLVGLSFQDSEKSEADAKLFNKNRKIEKVVIKHQIGYHFKKIVRTVQQELFISRKISVLPLVNGYHALKKAESKLTEYCDSLSRQVVVNDQDTAKSIFGNLDPKKVPSRSLLYVSDVPWSPYSEAKARCQALGMRLPEVYTAEENTQLSNFLKANNLNHCFAGIEFDLSDGIQKFIATGAPIWQGYHSDVYVFRGTHRKIDLKPILDDSHGRFLYTNVGNLDIFYKLNGAIFDRRGLDVDYWNSQNQFEQVMAPIVCAPLWNGHGYDNFDPKKGPKGLTITNHYRRVTRSIDDDGSQPIDSSTLVNACRSIAAQIGEAHTDIKKKMDDVLQLVDISVHRRNENGNRKKRAFLAKFVLKTGASLLWSVFGFYQDLQTERRFKKLETAMTVTRQQVEHNSALITNMSEVIYDHSIVINELKLTTTKLGNRLNVVENKVDNLASGLLLVNNNLEVMATLMLIHSMTTRIQISLNGGYVNLKDVIHCSLKGQTSPLILPQDQIQLVQNEINYVSSSVLDTDFSRMSSIVVSHPKDPTFLLVVVNAAALSRDGLELVELVPVPFYSNKLAHLPILDHQHVIFNQISATFTVLTKQERDDCMEDRCYIGSMAQPTSSASCGAPQYFDQSLNACEYESRPSNGVAIIDVKPDGFIFSFESEVSVQLFGFNHHTNGKPKKLQGLGILQIPTGSSLIATTATGYRAEVKGPPRYYSTDAADMDITANSILSIPPELPASPFHVPTRPDSDQDYQLEQQVITVQQAVMDTQHRMENQANHVWILTGCITSITIITIILIVVLYYKSRRFRKKVRMVKQSITELSQQISDVVKPHIPPRSPMLAAWRGVQTIATHARAHRRSNRAVSMAVPPADYLELDETKASRSNRKGRVYETSPRRDLSEVPKVHRMYPQAPPLDEVKYGYESGSVAGSGIDDHQRADIDAASIVYGERHRDPIYESLKRSQRK